MTTPKISIIIPTYQHAREIGLCLESIYRQTFKNYEIIVVNDGSTDDTLEVLKPHASRISLIDQENRGGNAARNRGFDASKGEFVIFCDADVVMRPDFLERLLETLEKNPKASYAYASFRFGWKTFRLWPFDADTLRRMNYIHTTSLIRRPHFPRFDESIRKLQDWDLWLTMLGRGHVGVWVPEMLFSVIPHKGGISTWVPGIFYRIPWRRLGLRVPSVEKYLAAEKIVKAKHGLR
ncbi:glycosyltransferase family 2 protein [Candidatus Uhrbacteria bacterium]|nr:glycosyltransferase family 2 protein [Candidatus Uhrbacteria bacterium]